MQLRYAYRLDPTPGQRIELAKAFGCARVVFNDGLCARQDAHAAGLPYIGDGRMRRHGLNPQLSGWGARQQRGKNRRQRGSVGQARSRGGVEGAELVGVADGGAAHHAAVVDGVLPEAPQRG
ncbi:MAG: helix-turn-helix domain-containing protein [Actinoallomurus sp.]